MNKTKVDLKTVYDLENPPFQKCPYCGFEEFYTNEYISGRTRYYQRFDGDEADNAEMYESAITSPIGVYAYCAGCEKRLFRYRNI